MKKALVVFAMLAASVAVASAIKVWSPGDTLSSTDLNANFAHIHSLMVGGHGARLLDADVSASAAIAHSKMANPALLPKAYVYVASVCSSSPCTMNLSYGLTSVTRTGTGLYQLNLNPARTNATFGGVVSVMYCSGSPPCTCNYEAPVAGTAYNIDCYDRTGAAKDVGFFVTLFDDNN